MVETSASVEQHFKVPVCWKLGAWPEDSFSAVMCVEDAQISSQPLYYCQSGHMHPRLWSICHIPDLLLIAILAINLLAKSHHLYQSFILITLPFPMRDGIKDRIQLSEGREHAWWLLPRVQCYIFLVLILLATTSSSLATTWRALNHPAALKYL